MIALVRYDAACKALAAAKAVDEAKKIRDLATAMQAYAKQAKNRQLEIDAAEIRIRAERRVGELIESQRQTVGLAPAGRPSKIGSKPDPISKPATLAAAGIDKKLSMRGQHYARLPQATREAIKIEALARLGELLPAIEKAKGKAGPGRGKAGSPAGLAFNSAPTLSNLGITKKVSSQAQQLARLPRATREAIKLRTKTLAPASPR